MHRPPDPQQPFGLATRARRAVDQPISELIARAMANPDLISLAAGLVDYATLPVEPVRQLAKDVLAQPDRARAALQYGQTLGLDELRHRLYDHLAQLDAAAPDAYPGSPGQLVLSTGSQQLLHILSDLLLDIDDLVITAWPSYFVYTGALTGMGARTRCIAMDEQGLIPDELDKLLAGLASVNQLPRVKIVYTCPYYQNPTGITLPAERRKQLLDVVKRHSTHHRILLIEDAAYRELYYETPPPASIKSYDTDNQYVALLQTFSKPFAPGLKTGYGLLPDELVEPVQLNKGGRDFGSANLSQHLLLEAMRQGLYEQHVQRLREHYRAKRDALLGALDEHFADMDDQVSWTRPDGGLYVWLTLPEGLDTGKDGPLFERAIKEGVLYVPGAYCYADDPRRDPSAHAMRLSFGEQPAEQLREGVARLARAVRAALQ